MKRRLLLGRKAMTNLYRILKSRDITLPSKVHIVKAMFFSSSHVRVVSGCKSWAIEKAEGRKIMLSSCDVGEDSLRVPWTARRSN